ncbi:unnamed protein product [Parascedosporium putredinis]|uniref:Uncharacterized protein n=1 Tax=Parascedosporium putredinis TaxID=1442378 RepID=A0A9P1H219_9PEZI|nr:unnamed protein product [Parascedosporium putredinis]CAI7994206.1 unnamed protein product [Parascedosporium putredinis]
MMQTTLAQLAFAGLASMALAQETTMARGEILNIADGATTVKIIENECKTDDLGCVPPHTITIGTGTFRTMILDCKLTGCPTATTGSCSYGGSEETASPSSGEDEDEEDGTLDPEYLSYYALTLVGGLPTDGPSCGAATGTATQTGGSSQETDSAGVVARAPMAWYGVAAAVAAMGVAM